MISKLNNKPFDESDETLFEVQLTYLWYNVDFNISNPYQHSMLTQYDREMQQSSKFIFRSQDDKKNWSGVEAERKERKFRPSLTSQFMSSFMQAITMRKCCEVTEV